MYENKLLRFIYRKLSTIVSILVYAGMAAYTAYGYVQDGQAVADAVQTALLATLPNGIMMVGLAMALDYIANRKACALTGWIVKLLLPASNLLLSVFSVNTPMLSYTGPLQYIVSLPYFVYMGLPYLLTVVFFLASYRGGNIKGRWALCGLSMLPVAAGYAVLMWLSEFARIGVPALVVMAAAYLITLFSLSDGTHAKALVPVVAVLNGTAYVSIALFIPSGSYWAGAAFMLPFLATVVFMILYQFVPLFWKGIQVRFGQAEETLEKPVHSSVPAMLAAILGGLYAIIGAVWIWSGIYPWG